MQKYLWGITTMAGILSLTLWLIHNSPVEAMPPQSDIAVTATEDENKSGASSRSCRHGTSLAYHNAQLEASNWLDLDWYLNFDYGDRYLPPHGEMMRMIRFKPEYDTVGQRTGRYLHAWAPLDDDGSDNGIPNEYNFYPDFDHPDFIESVRTNPGNIWIIGNEMATPLVQDSLMPATYAQAYYDAYNGIKRVDPTAQIAVGAILQVSPARLQYLDLVLEAYETLFDETLPADIWTFHAYTLPEAFYYDNTQASSAGIALGTDPSLARLSPSTQPGRNDIMLCGDDNINCLAEHDSIESFQTQVVDMRRWMRDNGYRDMPLILTEWGILLSDNQPDEFGRSFTYDRAATYLDQSLTYLGTAVDTDLGYSDDGHRLVQRWSWYNSYIPDLQTLGGPSSLVYPDGRLTPVGEVYQQHTAQGAQIGPDLFVDMVYPRADRIGESGEVSTTMRVRLKNRGDSRTESESIAVLTNELGATLGQVTIPSGIQGCGTGYYYATVELSGLPAGSYQVSAFLDEGSAPADRLPTDETPTGKLFIGTHGLFMPLIQE